MTERIRFLSPKQVIALTSLSRRTLNRLPDFPKPMPIYEGSNRLGYIESEVEAWLTARVQAARGNGHETQRADPPPGRPPRRAKPPPRRPQRAAAPKTSI
jgi:predicted DNA-binding transcriptional regulator AlpA